MDALKEIARLLAPYLITLPVITLVLGSLYSRQHRLEEDHRKLIVHGIKRTAYHVKQGSLPIDLLMDDLTHFGNYLAELPQDDILSKALEKYSK